MRLPGRGLHEGPPAEVYFDGKPYDARTGETLAATLLANGVRLMGRSFKYHRPRGILTAGSEEPNALVTVGRRGRQRPNVRATMQEIWDGFRARSQNSWPALSRDLMAVNDLAWPLLGAGFYYKTFMWPRGFWERVYEPMIRRAAGLGHLSGEPPEQASEKAFAFCDLLVIGAGPAGLMAALTAGRAGARVILADEEARMGGRLLSETHEIDGGPGHAWADGVLAELAALPNVRLMPRTTVTGAYDQGTYGALERVGLHAAPRADLPPECFWRIAARRAVLCAGAIERPVAFADNDRPGIMTASAVRTYLNRWGVAPGQRVTLFANNDDAHRTARDLAAAGVTVAGVVDSRDSAPEGDWPVYTSGRVTGTRGRLGLRSVTVTHAGGTREIPTDCLAVSGGWNPSVHLTCHMGARPVWDEARLAFLPPEGAVPGLAVAGAARGRFSTRACLEDGAAVAAEVLEALGFDATRTELPEAEDDPYRIAALWHVPGKRRAWLDMQNDVTVKDVAGAAAENFRSVEHMKRYTTQGMATDQGKTSNVAALAVLADATGRSIPETGTTTFRPPYTPVSIAAMGAGGEREGFAPVRRTTSDAAVRSRGAPMVEAGLWYRAAYFPKAGEKAWREACDREVAMVRGSVGVADVSTLGKIEVQGPDAAAFLDYVYANRMGSLKPGRVRYGIMLREDGHVMDDGTVACLGSDRYLVTTTTAAAGLVMAHMDYAAQVLRPEMDVRLTSVTEHWAQFAVAGPEARGVVASLLDEEMDAERWPFMSCGPVGIGGVDGRLFRISFSGEQGYEIAVPARYGASLWRLLLAQAEGWGGGPYGMEALNVLRIEKGFLTHAEIDGRVTAFDLGMQRMLSKPDFIGRAAAMREGLLDEDRPQLVGLRPVGAVAALPPGAFLFAPDAAAVREAAEGHVTSAAYSPTLGTTLAMGFLARGRSRHGETVKLVDHLRGVEVLCEVGDPVAYDPEGKLVRG
ncbi:sarcosine oxidase subunit alpha family protein [Histidinibacterium aquaticum]|uniref:Sarcosine oxidase subunit alpha family protein n=1 Tax=Histidinibacterium aquaticum TaxID=2613962 RepID=A0A5J5GPM6_9RHOB|nr:sarcosine oxidase subunit alpha family protein [Histidinibacterium aquaticum]KAA9010251.1 sarcosine oxidase subunit alpha family protein [Histidinibacterium aquaticum]